MALYHYGVGLLWSGSMLKSRIVKGWDFTVCASQPAHFTDAGRRHKDAGSKTKDSYLHPAIVVAWISASVLILGAPVSTGPHQELQVVPKNMPQVILQERKPKLRELESLIIDNEHVFPLPQRETLSLLHESVNKLLSSKAVCCSNIIEKVVWSTGNQCLFS